MQPIIIHIIKDVNAAPYYKSTYFESHFTAAFSVLESNGVDNVVAFVSNKIGIDTIAEFREAQFLAKQLKRLSYTWITYSQWHSFLQEGNIPKLIQIILYRIVSKAHHFPGFRAMSICHSLTNESWDQPCGH